MSYLPGKFVWFEHLSNDVPKARAFYEQLCGWTVAAMPMGELTYYRIMNGDTAIGGFRVVSSGMPNHWASYLSVPDVDSSFEAAKAAGAASLLAPMDFGPVGRGCAIADPSGAALYLWKGAQGDPQDAQQVPVGGWYWNELSSKDVKAALAFYEKAFGMDHDAMDMGPMGTYYVLKDAAGIARAGAMQQSEGMHAPSHWLPYIQMADCDAAAAKASQLGARSIIVPPTDIPEVGRFAVVMDPTGAAIAIIKGIPR